MSKSRNIIEHRELIFNKLDYPEDFHKILDKYGKNGWEMCGILMFEESFSVFIKRNKYEQKNKQITNGKKK